MRPVATRTKNGEIAKALMAKAPELFTNDLHIEHMEILAAK